MKPFACCWLVVSSLLCAELARGETRPQYGGTLHVTMRTALVSLDPADSSSPDSIARRTLAGLLFDTLVMLDDAGHPKPGLAESWQASRGNQRWQLRLRHGVKFSDGTALTGEIVASSLRFANASWNVRADGESVIIELDRPDPDMLAVLALPRNAVVKRDSTDKVSGTGPFQVVEWKPGKKLTVAAEDECWRGRPFLDAIEIEMGTGFRDQMTALEVGRADLVEVAPEQSHHFSSRGRMVSSAPMELLALVFMRDVSSPDEKLQREALAFSVERGSIYSVLLQGAGQLSGGLLPTWISGYGFVFPSQADLPKARQLRAQVQNAHVWTLGYDGSDALVRLLAERIALNAKDAGVSVVASSVGTTDLRVMRIALASANPWIALENLAAQSGLSAPKSSAGTADELYQAEQTALATQRVIPLFHLPVFYASGARLKNWSVSADGSLDLSHAWLEGTKP